MSTVTVTLAARPTVEVLARVCLDANWELYNTEGTLLSTGSIPSGDTDGIVAPDATVLINGNQFDTVASGDSIDLPVVNGGSNPVGIEQAGEWVIGNSAVTINGTQVGDIVAEDSLPIAVELDGNPSGTWNAGTQTWEVTGPVIAVRSAYDPSMFTVWVGWGSVGTTDQTPITIKRGITDPLTGLVTEAEAFGPWDDYLTLPYS